MIDARGTETSNAVLYLMGREKEKEERARAVGDDVQNKCVPPEKKKKKKDSFPIPCSYPRFLSLSLLAFDETEKRGH